jgi:hypothetical protein
MRVVVVFIDLEVRAQKTSFHVFTQRKHSFFDNNKGLDFS